MFLHHLQANAAFTCAMLTVQLAYCMYDRVCFCFSQENPELKICKKRMSKVCAFGEGDRVRPGQSCFIRNGMISMKSSDINANLRFAWFSSCF
jgi:hypothetical protein